MKTKLTRAAAIVGTAGAALAATAALGAGPANAATASPAAAVNQIAIHPNVVGYPDCGENFVFNSSNVRIRASWGTSAAVRGYGQKGQYFDASFRTSYEYNGYYWVYGQDFETGVTGYVALSLLTPDGPVGCTVLS
jgi:hypothetical protein